MNMIDSAWFYRMLEEKNASLRELAKFLQLDPSSVSRMLKGERKMSAEEQDRIAKFLDVGLEMVASRRRGEQAGFAENKQAEFRHQEAVAPETGIKMFTEADIVYKDGKRWMETGEGELLELHPMFGCMKGTMTIPDDLDLTAPADPDWGKVYEED